MKKKLWKKLLPLSTMLAITVGVPIVATACSTSTDTSTPGTNDTVFENTVLKNTYDKIASILSKAKTSDLEQLEGTVKNEINKPEFLNGKVSSTTFSDGTDVEEDGKKYKTRKISITLVEGTYKIQGDSDIHFNLSGSALTSKKDFKTGIEVKDESKIKITDQNETAIENSINGKLTQLNTEENTDIEATQKAIKDDINNTVFNNKVVVMSVKLSKPQQSTKSETMDKVKFHVTLNFSGDVELPASNSKFEFVGNNKNSIISKTAYDSGIVVKSEKIIPSQKLTEIKTHIKDTIFKEKTSGEEIIPNTGNVITSHQILNDKKTEVKDYINRTLTEVTNDISTEVLFTKSETPTKVIEGEATADKPYERYKLEIVLKGDFSYKLENGENNFEIISTDAGMKLVSKNEYVTMIWDKLDLKGIVSGSLGILGDLWDIVNNYVSQNVQSNNSYEDSNPANASIRDLINQNPKFKNRFRNDTSDKLVSNGTKIGFQINFYGTVGLAQNTIIFINSSGSNSGDGRDPYIRIGDVTSNSGKTGWIELHNMTPNQASGRA